MKVMLFVPPGGYFAERWSHGTMMPALGLSYIAAVLERDGVEVELVPSHVLGLSFRDVARKIESERPDVVGITTTTENRFQSFKLASVAKEAYPPAFVVLGGPHLKNTGADTLTHVPDVDAVVQGEGEETMRELCRALAAKSGLGAIQGLVWRDGAAVRSNPPRFLLPDLNTLPLPARHLEPWAAYNFTIDVPGKGKLPAANLMTSRGCPFTCTFCATPSNWGRKVRGLTAENVVAEIEHVMDRYGAKAIWFFDDTFNYSRSRTERICDLIIERRLDISWYCEVRVDILTKPLLAKMRDSGLIYTGFGIESGSERICREIITKNATLKEATDVIDWCNELGVTPNPFFIFSHPTETWEEAQETIRVLESVRDRADVSAAILHIYPGIPLEERARAEGKMPADFSWSVKHDPRVILLPAAQGHAPLYVDKLTWRQISELMFRFAFAHKKISLWRKIPGIVRSIRSLGDVKRYAIMLVVYLRHRLARAGGRVPSDRRSGTPHLSKKVPA